MKRALLCFLYLWITAILGAQQDRLDPLAHQATLITTTGKIYTGWLDGYRHDRVRLRMAADQGEVIFQFTGEEIRSLLFPGTEAVDDAVKAAAGDSIPPAIDLLEETWSLRAPYLPILDRDNRSPLLYYAEMLLETGRALEAVSRARRLVGIELDPAEAERMDRVIIQGFAAAGLHDEARVLAEEWCRTHLPSGSSALGWAVLARLALREENWEEALWLGLHPIAFGHDARAVGLADCYGAAIAAALELGDEAEAVFLINEMHRREIPWPDGDPLLTRASVLIESARMEVDRDSEAIPTDRTAGPPIPDPWLTLEAIRRVLAKPGS